MHDHCFSFVLARGKFNVAANPVYWVLFETKLSFSSYVIFYQKLSAGLIIKCIFRGAHGNITFARFLETSL